MKKCTENAQENSKQFEAYLSYAKDNYTSRVNAENLLALEAGLKQHLQQVQEALSNYWSMDNQKTVREVLESEEMEQCE